ncbi:hypothetical protein [Streptomyces sp. NRRL B-24484]|uniref:hypothetical protein n=1 Tax=Streptomyces sp. NRRL B-24484 TaxID=1463833 RepID=UPI0004BF0508|nr:hypothetical protein [Streptomyces sp. NRRL B-24484]
MSTTSDLITAAVLFGPGALLSIPVIASQRGARADSERVQAVLALSAYERAAALAETEQDAPAPPDGGEPITPVTEPAQRLATVIDFPARHAA